MFFDIIGLVSAEKRLINVVNLEKKGDHFSCLAARRMASVSICTLPLVVNEVTGVPFTVRSVICVSPFPYLMQNRHARSDQTYS